MEGGRIHILCSFLLFSLHPLQLNLHSFPCIAVGRSLQPTLTSTSTSQAQAFLLIKSTLKMSVAPKSEMQRDVDGWVARASATAKDPSGITNPTGSAEWSSSFFGCFDPIDTCAITCCCPCITFGKTHHRLHKDASLAGYSVVNASVCCLLFLPH